MACSDLRAPQCCDLLSGDFDRAFPPGEPSERTLVEWPCATSGLGFRAPLRLFLRAAAPSVVTRAVAQRAQGFPIEARAMLERDQALLAGLPGDDLPAGQAAARDADPAFAHDVAAERAFAEALTREAALLDREDEHAVGALWERMETDLSGTCVAKRAHERAQACVLPK